MSKGHFSPALQGAPQLWVYLFNQLLRDNPGVGNSCRYNKRRKFVCRVPRGGEG